MHEVKLSYMINQDKNTSTQNTVDLSNLLKKWVSGFLQNDCNPALKTKLPVFDEKLRNVL